MLRDTVSHESPGVTSLPATTRIPRSLAVLRPATTRAIPASTSGEHTTVVSRCTVYEGVIVEW